MTMVDGDILVEDFQLARQDRGAIVADAKQAARSGAEGWHQLRAGDTQR